MASPGSSNLTRDGYHEVAGVSRISLCMLRSLVIGQGS